MSAPPLVIAEPGVHLGVPEDAYHADCCPEPSLSCSVAELLLSRSPLHAAVAHPRLRAVEPGPRDEARFVMGTALHALLLEGEGRFAEVPAEDWRGKEAREAREHARAFGRIPILSRQLAELRLVADLVREQMGEHPDLRDALAPGNPREATVLWRDGKTGVWCRCRPDLVTPEAIVDFKFTQAAATDEEWGARTAFRLQYPLRASFYLRGWRAATGQARRYWFCVVEAAPPYALALFEVAPRALEMGAEAVEHAVGIWERCLRSGAWPSYSTDRKWIEPPAWEEFRHETRKGRAVFGTHRALDLAIQAQQPEEPTR